MALAKMYQSLCCYCEGQVAPVRADEIEHRQPVDQFPQQVFDWQNLHLACRGCNLAKSNKWDSAAPILDAVTDVPIEDHLYYQFVGRAIYRYGSTKSGRTTVKHADLNREALLGARTEVIHEIINVIVEINADPADPRAANAREVLEGKTSGEFGSMVQWAIGSLLRQG